ncbi:hypothetical protein PI126_g18417 [Phytophthora idaei]|nr:hypothetical protein PI126_g18417 [Phytophthora idaei]
MAFTRNEESKQEDNEPEQDETFVPAMPKNEQEEEFKRKETYTPARSKETVDATFDAEQYVEGHSIDVFCLTLSLMESNATTSGDTVRDSFGDEEIK